MLLVARKVKVFAEAPQVSPQGFGVVQHALRRHRVTHHHWFAGTHDARFLKANQLAGVAEQFHVVEVNTGDERAVGIENIHGIQPATQPDLQNHDIEFGIGQQLQNSQRRELKISQRYVVTIFFGLFVDSVALDMGKACSQICSTDYLTPDPTALFKIHQMRRGVDPCAVTRLSQDRLEHGAT